MVVRLKMLFSVDLFDQAKTGLIELEVLLLLFDTRSWVSLVKLYKTFTLFDIPDFERGPYSPDSDFQPSCDPQLLCEFHHLLHLRWQVQEALLSDILSTLLVRNGWRNWQLCQVQSERLSVTKPLNFYVLVIGKTLMHSTTAQSKAGSLLAIQYKIQQTIRNLKQ